MVSLKTFRISNRISDLAGDVRYSFSLFRPTAERNLELSRGLGIDEYEMAKVKGILKNPHNFHPGAGFSL